MACDLAEFTLRWTMLADQPSISPMHTPWKPRGLRLATGGPVGAVRDKSGGPERGTVWGLDHDSVLQLVGEERGTRGVLKEARERGK